MSASHRARGVPPWVRGLLVLSVVGALAASCVASSPSTPSASPSPPFSPYVDPNPSPPFSPYVDPNPSPPPSPYVDPNPSPPPGGWAPSWQPAGEMVGVPFDINAVVLADGRVMVVAEDWTPDDPHSPAVQLWDPATDAWTAAADLGKVRSDFALVALADGRALIAGGLNEGGAFAGQSYSSAYVVNPVIGPRPGLEEWTKVGLMTTARAAPSAALLPDGRVLVAGGYFNTGSSEAAAPAPDADPAIELAAYHPAPTGGPRPTRPPLDDIDMPPHGYALATAELFDPVRGTWSRTGSMRFARYDAAVVTLSDGRVLLVGSGSDGIVGVHPDANVTAEIYDPSTGRFTLAGRLPAIDHAAIAKLGVKLPSDEGSPGPIGTLVALPDGGALLVGYDRWWKHQADIVRSFRFDAGSLSWTDIDRPCASAEYDVGVVVKGGCWVGELTVGRSDGSVLAIGGRWVSPVGAEETPLAARLLDPTTGRWTKFPPLPAVRRLGTAVALPDGSVLVFGGFGGDGELVRAAVRYVP